MPARDLHHERVKNALIKEQWIITHDPLRLQWGTKDMYVDLGAERLIAASKAGQKIAIEIKNFTGLSRVADLEQALGQYTLYYDVLSQVEPDRTLSLAIPSAVYSDLFAEPLGQLLLAKQRLRLAVFDPQLEVIEQWIP